MKQRLWNRSVETLATLTFFITTFVVGRATTLRLENKCKFVVWAGIQGGAGKEALANGGVKVNPAEAVCVDAPSNWSGRIWGRHGCTFNTNGTGSCDSGDCGGVLHCNGAGGTPPATLAEFTLGGYSGLDYYDVSVVDGYNMPMAITPGRDGCARVGCVTDLNRRCPAALQVRNGRSIIVGCRSACSAFSKDEFCCTGSFASPDTCRPSFFSKLFKSACPTAYTYAFDDPSSLVTCSSASLYTVTFCPPC